MGEERQLENVYVFERENMLNKEEDREMLYVVPELGDRPAVKDESRLERNEGKELLCELR